jgi:hypothetical protein
MLHPMTEKELCKMYLEIVEDSVKYFEPLWVDDSKRVPNSGFFDFRKYGNWKNEEYASLITIPGNGMVIYCYSVLLNESLKETFTELKIPRSLLLSHAIKAIRWCCLTSAYVENSYPYLPNTDPEFLDGQQWQRKISYRADVVGCLTLGVALLWNELNDETKSLVKSVMIGGAAKKRDVKQWQFIWGGNHDQVKQDLSSTMGAAFLFAGKKCGNLYLDILRGMGIDMVSTLQDKTCDTIVDGRTVKEWAKGWNLYQDYSSDHHGCANPWYGGDLIFQGRIYIEIMSALTGIAVPETFAYDGNGFDGVLEWLKILCLPEGEPASPHGIEYDAYYGEGLLAYCYGATVKKDPVAASFEERAAYLLKRHSRAIKMYDYHRSSWAKAASAFLLHKYSGPRAEPLPFEEASRRIDGTYHYRWQQNLIHRSREKWCSFAWGSISSLRPHSKRFGNGLCGFVVPTKKEMKEPEQLIYFHPNTLIGNIVIVDSEGKAQELKPESIYRFERNDVKFNTAGNVSNPMLQRYYAFHSFLDGPCVMFTVFRAKKACRVFWSGLPIYFYVRKGMTGSRRIYDEQGSWPLEQEARRNSSWWCVNDRIGMAVIGGNNQIKIKRFLGYNRYRKAEYLDKCDGVIASQIRDLKIDEGELGLDLSTVIFTNTRHENVSQLSKKIKNLIKLPTGWRGLLVPDANNKGKRLFAFTNLYGHEKQTQINFSFEEGAPIFSSETFIEGKRGFVWLHLDALESLSETMELYVELLSGNAVWARKITNNRYFFRPVDGQKAHLKIRYCGNEAEKFLMFNGSCKKKIINSITSVGSFKEFDLLLENPIFIEIQGENYLDQLAPAVEIENVVIREDRRVTVEVKAQDQSNIREVELYCNKKSIGKKYAAPYLWTFRPGKGFHTFYAVAVDSSSAMNRATSFVKTISVN